MTTAAHIIITPGKTTLDGRELSTLPLTGLYRQFIGGYPKFFKMDGLCRLGFIGAELLLKNLSPAQLENTAIILFNRSGSLATDRNYQQTISDKDNYFPSPSLFVYTLANIVTGEIAIRHKIYGETSFYIMDQKDDTQIERIVSESLLTSNPGHILCGWVEYVDENCYLADLKLMENQINKI